MQLNRDVALIGTGLAPLIAAASLISQGRSVLVLNPDSDFFLEDSELPLDPLAFGHDSQRRFDIARLKRSLPESVLETLRPDFPGAVELWSSSSSVSASDASPSGRVRDVQDAPFVRARSRLMVSGLGPDPVWKWSELEDQYLKLSDAGLRPQILEGLQAVRKFPGMAALSEEYRALSIPKLCDVDVSRYRLGMLEFIKERLGSEGMISSAHPIERTVDGLRFRSDGKSRVARIHEATYVFWTPLLSSWIRDQFRDASSAVKPVEVKTQSWEQWTLLSRDPINPAFAGHYQELLVWGEEQGMPQGSSHALSVLRACQAGWVSDDALKSLSRLCSDFLGWDRFSVRALRTRSLMDWSSVPEARTSWTLDNQMPPLHVIPRSDGAVFDVVRAARQGVA